MNAENNNNRSDGATETPESSVTLLQIVWRRRGFVLLGALVGLTLGYLHYSRAQPIYQSTVQVLVIKKRVDAIPMAFGDQMAYFDDYLATHVLLLRSPKLADLAVEEGNLRTLRTFEGNDAPVGALLSGLTVTRVEAPGSGSSNGGSSNVLSLAFRGPVSEDCGVILAAVINGYQKFLKKTYKSDTDEAWNLIEKAHKVLRGDLKKCEDDYIEYRKKSKFWRSKEGSHVDYERIGGLETKRNQLQLRLMEINDKIRTLKEAVNDGRGAEVLVAEKAVAPTPIAPPKRSEELLFDLLLQEKRLTEDYGRDHPEVRGLRNRIEAVREQLNREGAPTFEKTLVVDPVERILRSLEYEGRQTKNSLESVSELLDKLKTEAKSLADEEFKENHLRNEVARVQAIYDGTVKRLQEVNLSRDSGGFDAQPLSEPYPGGKVAPNPTQIFMAALFLGLVAGAGGGYLVDSLDKRFRSPEEIRRRLGLPIVGHIAHITANAEASKKRKAGEATLDPALCTYWQPKSSQSEGFRAVRTALFFSALGVGHKVVQVTSPNKSDGKSLVISNLAVAIAQAGKSVLLIDADCRRPRLHKVFGVEVTRGLTSFLTEDCLASACTIATAVPGLDLIPCGPIPQNPSELLIGPRFRELLEASRDRYDYVLVDTPPILAVNDPCVVASGVDGLLFTIRLTPKGRPDAERAREILRPLGVNVLGVVVNGLDDKKGQYGYGYGYGYGYYSSSYQHYYQEENDDEPAAHANGSV
jgi:capsular exopolysaccharide synthesis family protein